MKAQSLMERRYLWWQTAYAANQVRTNRGQATPVFYCVHIEEITGHRASPDPTEIAAGFTRPLARDTNPTDAISAHLPMLRIGGACEKEE